LNKKRIGLTLVLALLSEIANKIVPLISLHIVAERLGTSGFGIAQFAQWLIDWGIVFTVYGFAQIAPILLRETVSTSDQRAIHGSIVFSRLILALLATGCITALIYGSSEYETYRWAVVSGSIVLFTSAIDASWILLARQKMALWSILSITAKFTSLFAIIYFIRSPDDASLFVFLTSCANGLISIGSALIARSMLRIERPTAQHIHKVFRLATPFAISTIFVTLLERYDLYIVEHHLGTGATGIYAGASRIATSLYPVVAAVSTVFYSEMIGYHDRESIERLVRASLFWSISLIAPAVVGIWFVDERLITVIFSQNFSSGAQVLSILIASGGFYILTTIFGFQLLTLKTRWKPLTIALASGAFFGLAVARWLMDRYGMTGIAISSLVAKMLTALILTVSAIHVWQLNRWNLAKSCLKALAPSLLMGGTLFALLYLNATQLNLTETIMLGGGIYVITFFSLNFHETLAIFRKLRHRVNSVERDQTQSH
jgi:O-antigen/teichoic acid export membrane protein